MSTEERRANVVRIARTWLRTPYHEAARVRGAGVDCAQVVYAVFLEAGECPKIDIAPYSAQMHLHDEDDHEPYIDYILTYAREISAEQVQAGDLVVYQIGRKFAHGAIVVSAGKIIHAFKEARAVIESNMDEGYLAAIGRKPRPRRYFTVF